MKNFGKNHSEEASEISPWDKKHWWVYVLECENEHFYVGIAQDWNKRIDQHFKGKGAKFTKLHKPIRIDGIMSTNTDVKSLAQVFENNKAKEYARKYGYACVGGGSRNKRRDY